MESKEQTGQSAPEEPAADASSAEREPPGSSGEAPAGEQGGAGESGRHQIDVENINDADFVSFTGVDNRVYDNRIYDYSTTTKQFSGDEDRMVVLPIDQGTIQRLRRIFVQPPGYKKILQNMLASSDRVCLIHGNENSGKLTCAINLARDLVASEAADAAKIYIYPRRADETRPLVEVVRSDQICGGSAVIVEDVFEKKIPGKEFQSPELDWLRGALNDRRIFLILTARLSPVEAEAFSLPKVSTRGLDLFKVLVAQFKCAQAQAGEEVSEETIRKLEANWSALKKSLRDPQQIERFCQKLIENFPADDAGLLNLAQQSARMGKRALRDWFSGLKSNERLFATLVYLCAGAERPFIEQLYGMALRFLREDGLVWFTDARKLGLDDILENIQGRDLGGYIDFRERSLEEEVRLQIGNWAHLLWSVADAWIVLVDRGEEWESWQIRRALGVTLGRLCVHGNTRFEKALRGLASHPSTRVSVIPGYALEAAVRQDPEGQAQLTLRILESWAGSGDPDFMWAAGSAIRRVYDAFKSFTTDQALAGWALGMQELLIKQLEELVSESVSFDPKVVRRIEMEVKERADAEGRELEKAVDGRCWGLGQRIRDCAQSTLQSIVLADPSRAFVLARWLREGRAKSFKREVAENVVQEIFETLGKIRHKTVDQRQAPLLGLVEPVLEVAGRGARDLKRIDQVFLTVKSWLRWPGWYEPVFQALLNVANGGSSAMREKLRAALLRLWLHRGSDLEAERAFGIAQAVIARAYAMDGILMDRPRFGQCVFVIDPTFLNGDEEVRDRKEKVYRHLVGVLEAQVDVSVVHLGSRDAVRLGEDHSALPMAMDHPVPPLVMPALEAASRGETRLILVLTTRRVWDLEDAASRPWAKDFFVVASGDGASECEGVETIPIGEDPKPEDMATVEKALQVRWARALAKAEPGEWWDVLQSFDRGAEIIEEGPRPWLNRLVAGVADIRGATGHGDLARKILCIVGWYASRDLRACARLLRSWLEEPVENEATPCRRWMGAAGARALFSIHSAETPSPEDSAPEILFEELAAPLAAQGRDGSEAVLRAVWQWIEEPVWAWYLANDVVEGRGRLLRWAERFAPQHAGELRRLLPEVKPVVLHDGREALAAMIERIRVRAALGAPRTLPDLDGGERYAVIALDGSDLEARKPANLDSVAIEFCRSLTSLNGHGLKPVIYRLGERRPVWVANVLPPRDALLAPEAPRQARLLGPILTDPGLSPERVKFVFVLSVQPLLDAEDWLNTEWRSRIVFYRPGAGPERHPGFAALPALAGNPAGLSIARFLLQSSAGEGPASAAA